MSIRLLFLLFIFPVHGQQLFSVLLPENSGITFENTLTETEAFNYFHFDYFYNGGGVAVGDINNDGLPDIYFVGNQVQDKLYLNKGNLKFIDISANAGIEKNQKGWHTGVTMVDINADGWLDIYVCRSGSADEKSEMRNLLYINQKDNTFKESAIEYGLDDPDRSVHAAFFDYDKDGDLDVFVINHLKNISFLTENSSFQQSSNKLYRNDNGKFVDVTFEAEVAEYGYSIGVGISDLNNDGWPDIYVANDFMLADFMYINQKDGTFKNEVKDRTGHIPTYSMGLDIADINNDLLPDIYVADMASEDHVRSKKNMGSMNTIAFWENVHRGEHYQFMFNCLQLNSSIGIFREIAQLAHVAKTDWSWAPLIADFDNDGWKDIFVTNGIYRDVRNNDYLVEFNKKYVDGNEPFNAMNEISQIPMSKINNYGFKNNGDLTFSKQIETWGLEMGVNSNGAAYADLDNDGDLDLILNNCNEVAHVLENTSQSTNYLILDLYESANNQFGIGAKVTVTTTSGIQFQEVYTARGFQSSVPPQCHFGIPVNDEILRVEVIWNDGSSTNLSNVKKNQRLKIIRDDSARKKAEVVDATAFLEIVQSPKIVHKETFFNDFEREVLLPNKMSQLGPFISTGDVNNDGLDDFYIGGAIGQIGGLHIQSDKGFILSENQPWQDTQNMEELGSVFFDVDDDGDLDLYVVSGSNENDQKEDRLYRNDGNGNFTHVTNQSLPVSSGMRVIAHDVNNDGWMDLIVPGRQVPGKYPSTPKSTILINNKGVLEDVTKEIAPDFEYCGMVTDVLFYDYDFDGDEDLIVVGEWMGITFFNNEAGKYKLDTTQLKVGSTVGWWNTIYSFDIDQDGSTELLLGNIGLNNKFHPSQENPLHIFYEDFDQSGTNDIVLAKHQKENFYPVRGRQCSSEQMPFLQEKFPTYNAFATASLEKIYGQDKLDESLHFEAREFRSGMLKLINEKWTFIPFENELQIGPINAFLAKDITGDGKPELLIVGNKYEAEVETARYDSNFGDVLEFYENGYRLMDPKITGILLNRNVKDMKEVGAYIVVGCNDDQVIILKRSDDK